MRNFAMGSSTREQATLEHCMYAFNVLDAQLHGLPLPDPTFPDAHTALFVTWNIRSSSSSGSGSEGRLRGCIGTLEPRQLHVALRDYALTAALRDSRFPAIEARELPRLTCKVSLLSCFERASSWQDWEVGTHGIVIEYIDPQLGCRRSATFLPEVAHEQGWSVPETLDALVRKSGYSGRVDAALLNSITLTRYQSSVLGITWEQYQEELQARGGALDVGAGREVGGPEHVVGASNQLVSVTTTRGRAA